MDHTIVIIVKTNLILKNNLIFKKLNQNVSKFRMKVIDLLYKDKRVFKY
jgi:hypothetical protein